MEDDLSRCGWLEAPRQSITEMPVQASDRISKTPLGRHTITDRNTKPSGHVDTSNANPTCLWMGPREARPRKQREGESSQIAG